MVDAPDSGSGEATRGGSTPLSRTKFLNFVMKYVIIVSNG